MRRFLLLALAALAIAIAMAGCPASKGDPKIILFGEQIELDPIWFTEVADDGDYRTQQFAVCGSANTFILRLDTASTPNGWDYTFLLGPNHDLRGCKDTPWSDCTGHGRHLGFQLSDLSRFSIEGISVGPTEIWNGYDVTCRGVADRSVHPEDLVASTTSGPRFRATLRMLRVGGSSPLFVASGNPNTRFGAAASFSDPTLGIGMEAGGPQGRIAHAGGLGTSGAPVATIFELDPHTLTLAPATDGLGTAVAGLSASLLAIEGAPQIGFSGGADAAGAVVDDLWLYATNGGIARTVTIDEGGRVFHGTTAIRRPDGWWLAFFGGGGGVIWPSPAIEGAPLTARAVVFIPPDVGQPAWNNLTCTEDTCKTLDAPGIVTGHSGHAAWTRIGEDVFLLGGADATGAATNTRHLWHSSSGHFSVSGLLPAPLLGGAAATADATVTPDVGGSTVLAGGIDCDLATCVSSPDTDATWITDPDAPGAPSAMSVPRVFATATSLRDRTVLLAGGVTSWPAMIATSSLDRFLQEDPDGDVDSLDRPMVTSRWGHTATRLDATRTWIEGAVVLVGGAAPGEPAAEIFVPAYLCGGAGQLVPVSRVAGDPPIDPSSNPDAPVFCDVDRGPETITNPRNKALHVPPS